MKNLKYFFKKAQKEKWAIGQFNFSTLEQLRGILIAAQKLKSPLILGTSRGESEFLGLREIIALVEISKMKYKVSAFLNLDHAKDLEKIKQAVDFGYSAVHFDGSDLPFEENIKNTKKVADYAHKKGVLVEGELGFIKGESEYHNKKLTIKERELTLPNQVLEFVKRTKVDSLAISIGSAHGVYSESPKLDFERLRKIRKKTKAFLVLHGGSGISKKDIRKAIELGVVKININTEIRMVWKKVLEKALIKEIKPYKILPLVQNKIAKKTEEKIKLFGF